MQEVGCVDVWWNAINVIMCLLVLIWLCCTIGIVCGLLVVGQDFLDLLEERDGAVLGVIWPLPSGSALNAHHPCSRRDCMRVVG